jgi:GNAT superfamily N-acetyltransferase
MIDIVPLQDRPDAISIIAKWRFEQWGHQIPGSSLASFAHWAREGLRDDGLPQTWISLSSWRVTGVAGLSKHDIHTRPDLSPWLVGVYVNKDDRGQGIGSALVDHVVRQAAKMGIKKLWLFTPDKEHFYRRLGWQRVEQMYYRGEDVVIMNIEPNAER